MKVSIATIISIALCWFRLPVAKPNFALHHAAEIAGAAHVGSMSDFAPSWTARYCSSLATWANGSNRSSLTVLACSMKLLTRTAMSVWTSIGSCRTLSRCLSTVLS